MPNQTNPPEDLDVLFPPMSDEPFDLARQRMLVELGHPMAPEYLMLRAFYRDLTPEGDLGWRYVTKSPDGREAAEFFTPMLQPAAARMDAAGIAKIVEMLRDGNPKATAFFDMPHHWQGLQRGRWYIRTLQKRMMLDLWRIRPDSPSLHQSPDGWEWGCVPDDVAEFNAVLAVIERYQGCWARATLAQLARRRQQSLALVQQMPPVSIPDAWI